jgi:hypothetical protein
MDIFCGPIKSNEYFLNMRSRFLNFWPCLLNRKMNVKFLLAALKRLTNSKDCPVSRIKFLCRLSYTEYTLIVEISPIYIDGRLSKQLPESQAAFGITQSQAASGNPEVSNFRSMQKLYFGFSSLKDSKKM